MKTVITYIIILCSLFGIADAGFLTWQKLSGYLPPCSSQFKCEAVLNSQWSQVGPIPLSAFGVLFYTAFLVTGSLYFVGNEKVRPILMALGLFGISFSSFLILIMGVILRSWCLYCLLSAANCVVLFILSSLVYFQYRKEKI